MLGRYLSLHQYNIVMESGMKVSLSPRAHLFELIVTQKYPLMLICYHLHPYIK
jgi:hypothetical protein